MRQILINLVGNALKFTQQGGVIIRLATKNNTLFISALSDTQEKLQSFELGAVDYVTKPYQREELLGRVRTHLEIDCLRNHLEVMERSQQLAESENRLSPFRLAIA